MQKGRGEITRTIVIIVATINALSINTSLGAPSAYDPRLEIQPQAWQENSLAPIITEPCRPMEPCWEWLPVVQVDRENDQVLREESKNSRLEDEPRMNEEMNSPTDPWRGDSRIFVPRSRSSSSNVRQISPRPVKKDVFMSRSWGPGGLPFSVLYMNPHGARSNNNNRRSTGISEVAPTKIMTEPTARRAYEASSSTASPTKHPNYRVGLRNGSNGQPRRQYSIIPQLFISYGWGPLGK